MKRRGIISIVVSKKHFTTWMNEARAQNVVNNPHYAEAEYAEYAQCYRLIFKSGLSISIQASEHHYSKPREYSPSYAVYTQFELGFPNIPVPEIAAWAQMMSDDSSATNAIYPYTPREAIELMTINNGGVVGWMSPIPQLEN